MRLGSAALMITSLLAITWRFAAAFVLAALLFAVGWLPSLAQSQPHTSNIAFDRVPLGALYANVEAYAILQDDQGMIWFGTSDGLTRYDGYTRVAYVHDPAGPTSIGGLSAILRRLMRHPRD
jgi:Two component regulator propeller